MTTSSSLSETIYRSLSDGVNFKRAVKTSSIHAIIKTPEGVATSPSVSPLLDFFGYNKCNADGDKDDDGDVQVAVVASASFSSSSMVVTSTAATATIGSNQHQEKNTSDDPSNNGSSASSSEEDEDDDDEEKKTLLFKNQVVGKQGKSQDKKLLAKQLASENLRKEELAAFRKRLRIHVKGSDIPDPLQTFDELLTYASTCKPTSCSSLEIKPSRHMIRNLLTNIEASDYKEPTAVQMQSLPFMLTGRDVLAIAPTGSGKTAAYLIPTLARLTLTHANAQKRLPEGGLQALIMAPTRELTKQIYAECVRLCHGKKCRITLLSKANLVALADQGAHKVDVLIATPLRLVEMIEIQATVLSHVRMLVLDEADQFFSPQFITQIDQVLAACTHPTLQRAMFSATMLEGVEELVKTILRDPLRLMVGAKNGVGCGETIRQELVFVGKEEGKLVAIKQLIEAGFDAPALIFVQDIARARALYQELLYAGVNVDVIHSDKTKEQRDVAIRNFRTGQSWMLIATDLMSRGMDFKAVNLVINYDFPTSAVSYIHRVGRTGRAGRLGHAITYYTENDMTFLRAVANVMHQSGGDVPAWMLTLKKTSARDKKARITHPPKRPHISTTIASNKQWRKDT